MALHHRQMTKGPHQPRRWNETAYSLRCRCWPCNRPHRCQRYKQCPSLSSNQCRHHKRSQPLLTLSTLTRAVSRPRRRTPCVCARVKSWYSFTRLSLTLFSHQSFSVCFYGFINSTVIAVITKYRLLWLVITVTRPSWKGSSRATEQSVSFKYLLVRLPMSQQIWRSQF